MDVQTLLAPMWMGTPVAVWVGFLLLLGGLLVFDLTVMHRKAHEITVRESTITTAAFAGLAVLFAIGVGVFMGREAAENFLTGYVVEMSLSMDNVFVIAMILGYFKIPKHMQHGVLFWGIMGVVILRGVMIVAGAFVIEQFHAVLYLFGAFLIFTGVKMLLVAEHGEDDLSKNKIVMFLKRFGRVTDTFYDKKFFVRLKDENTGHYAVYMTPLFVALIMVELADVMFAVDSVPAIFAITSDPFIVFTSNIFAILGLRSLYFALSAVLDRFAYVKVSLAVLLMFIGAKMFVSDMLGWVHISSLQSLAITGIILASGIGYSLYKTARHS